MYIHFPALYHVSWNQLCLGDLGQTSHNNPCCVNSGWDIKINTNRGHTEVYFPGQYLFIIQSFQDLLTSLSCFIELYSKSKFCSLPPLWPEYAHILQWASSTGILLGGHTGLQNRCCTEQPVNIARDLPGKSR